MRDDSTPTRYCRRCNQMLFRSDYDVAPNGALYSLCRSCRDKVGINRPIPVANPSGICMCGCGGKTKPVSKTSREDGYRKGDFARYLPHHSVRKSPVDFVVEDRGYETPCHIWQLGARSTGYGTVQINGKKLSAHVAAFVAVNGPVPDGHEVHHKCNVRPCVNADHLEATPRAAHKRLHAAVKLNEEQVAQIRSLGGTVRNVDIAKMFNINPVYVGDILRGKYW